MSEEIIKRAAEIITERSAKNDHNFVTLALMNIDGYPYTTTISTSKSEGIKWLTFCTGTGKQAEKINYCNKASVCINDDTYHISLVGTIEEITDPEIKKEMWYSNLSAHFTGYDDPNYCVLKFTTERYSLFVDWNEAKGTL
ncbi:MAG TPA: pyridoxamine 5'-phosphate oxidase family protein [Lachnospiraceae bacterium]|nr:pyridoxamine 5'-phosphate oxidase family protein [Lachnospiraceae bacterium]